jgi:hypothetical protein
MAACLAANYYNNLTCVDHNGIPHMAVFFAAGRDIVGKDCSLGAQAQAWADCQLKPMK